MEIFTNAKTTNRRVLQWRKEGEIVGFVPTMGYLHDGHLSLVKLAKLQSQKVIVSIFVNPTQFNDPKDFASYPIDIEKDKSLLEKMGVDALYLPPVEDIYPNGMENTHIWVDVEGLDSYLCGASRPGHFRGVLTVVARLFNIVRPHIAIFGKKDWQQARIIQAMVTELFFDTEIMLGEIQREDDGLAMSSRNVRLSPEARRHAPGIYRALKDTKDYIRTENSAGRSVAAMAIQKRLEQSMQNIEESRLDYAEVVDKFTLEPQRGEVDVDKTLLAVALYFDSVRLIDNMEL